MRKLAPFALIALLAACQDSPTTPASLPAVRTAALSNDSYIVLFRPGVNVDALTQQLLSLHSGQLEHTYHFAVHGFAAHIPASEIESIRLHPDVVHIERDEIMHTDATQSPVGWGLDRIDQTDLPLNSSYSYTATGAGVTAYIIDTGIRTTHVEFGGRASGVFTAIGGGTEDCNGHGTHVAGIVGSARWGVAKQVSLKAVRVLDCTGSGNTSGVIAGVDWVTANAVKPAVANMSLGGPASVALDQAVQSSIASGITYAVAAGNNNGDACLGSPARLPEALTVGATTITDARASYSNFGTCLDIFAPGSGIVSAYMNSDTDSASLSGTSMATPHVVGVAALYLEGSPLATPPTVAAAITAGASLNRVTSPGTGSVNRLLFTGLNVAPNAPPVANFTWSCPTLTCSLDATSSTDDGSIVQYNWDLGRSPNPTASGSVLSVTYPHSGPRTVTLTVTDNGGKTASVTKVLTVGPAVVDNPPIANFTASCSGLTCSLNASSSTDDNSIASYAWSMPGANAPTASGVTATATYAAAGTKSITLTVTDNAGQPNSLTKTVTVAVDPVDNPPTANFTWSCVGLTCSLDASSSFDDGSIVQYNWDLRRSPNPTATGKIISVDYPHPSQRTVVLTVTDNTGKTGSITRIVTVGSVVDNPPAANFTWSCANLTCVLDASTSTDDGTIVEYAWDLNKSPNPTASGMIVSIPYAHVGQRTIVLTVKDNTGKTGSVTKVITVQ